MTRKITQFEKKNSLFSRSQAVTEKGQGESVESQQRITTLEKSEIDRKRMEEVLLRAAQEWRATFDAVEDSIALVDLEGRIIRCNRAMANLLGKPFNGIIGQSCHRLVYGMPEPLKAYSFERMMRACCRETIILQKGEQWFDVTIDPMLSETGHLIGGVCIMSDITERKLAEETLKRAHDDLERRVEARTIELSTMNDQLKAEIEIRQRAEEELKKLADELARSNADLKDFAYVASHDLKKPLQSIEGFVKLLARHYKGKLDAKADEFIEYIGSGVKRMEMLIKDLLDYSQIGTKENIFELTDCSFIVKTAVGNLRAAIEESNAVVTHDELPAVMSDTSLMISLFQNLIDNAIKFRCEEAPRIHISSGRKEGEWIFSIRDNGIGIDPKDSERIFGMFQRLQGSTDYPGTGIGLAICKKIIERHHGRIWVESEIGKGSTFHFTIPVKMLIDGI